MTEINLNHLRLELNEIHPISDDAWGDLASNLTLQKLEKDEIFQDINARVTTAAFLVTGCLAVSRYDDCADEQVLFFNDNRRRQFIGVLESFISEEPKDSDVIIKAIVPSTIVTVEYATIESLYAKHHSFETFGRKLMERQYLLALEQARFRQFLTAKDKNNALKKDLGNLYDQIPKGKLASYLGIKQGSLSRILGEKK